MGNTTVENKAGNCFNCKTPVQSVLNSVNHFAISTELDYQDKISEGMGMYCPNCDHHLCLACLPTIGAKSGKKLFGGLFSRTKPEKEMSIEDLPLDNAMRNNLEEKLKVKGTRIVVLKCDACGAYFGQFPEDKAKFVENFANKITEDYEDITIAEITTFINDLQLFISRLERHNLISQRAEQLRGVLELAIKQTGLPKLKQLITQYIENKEYDEARQMCATGTQWNGYLKNKGSWENDLQSMEAVMNLSKSGIGIGQKKTLYGGPAKIISVKTKTSQSDDGDIKLSKFKAQSHLNMADTTVSNNGDLQFALNYYDQAIEIYERLVNTKEGKELETELAKAYGKKAVALMEQGDNQASVKIFDKAIEIYERLVSTEGRKDLENDLAEVCKNKEAVVSRLGGHIDESKLGSGNKGIKENDPIVTFKTTVDQNVKRDTPTKYLWDSFNLGFHFAQLCFNSHKGDIPELSQVRNQFKVHGTNLMIGESILDELPHLKSDKWIENWSQGTNSRNVIFKTLTDKYGDVVASAFGFGFDSLNFLVLLKIYYLDNEVQSEMDPTMQTAIGHLNQHVKVISDAIVDSKVFKSSLPVMGVLKTFFSKGDYTTIQTLLGTITNGFLKEFERIKG